MKSNHHTMREKNRFIKERRPRTTHQTDKHDVSETMSNTNASTDHQSLSSGGRLVILLAYGQGYKNLTKLECGERHSQASEAPPPSLAPSEGSSRAGNDFM